MNVNFPPAPPTIPFLAQMVNILRQAFGSVVSKDEAVSRIMLLDTNGVTWQVTVDTSGNLQTAVNTGKSRV